MASLSFGTLRLELNAQKQLVVNSSMKSVMDDTQELIVADIRCNRYLVLCPRAMQSMLPTCGNESNLSSRSKTPALLSATTACYQSSKCCSVVMHNVTKTNVYNDSTDSYLVLS